MTQKIAYAKTILLALPHVERYCDAIAKANLVSAQTSYGLDNTYELMERIIDKTYKAQTLHNVKVKVLGAIDKAPKKHKDILKLYFFEKKKAQEIAQIMGTCERTAFRAVDAGVEWLGENLESAGLGVLVMKQLISNYKWIRTIYEQVNGVN
jgi:DNA-directed RNA polymerase specialized sigma subunit